jgi:DNA repair exonuclease SbcCD ATPase subunit
MKIKHKLLTDYQFLSNDKKIFLIKAGTIIEEYLYKVKNESISIDKEIVDANPEIFQIIDWKAEMLTYMKAQKLPTPAQLHKKIVPFIEEMVLSSIQQNSGNNSTSIDESKVREVEWKEIDLNNREKRIKDKEEEIDIRLKRVEKREEDHKQELKNLDKKEDDLRERSRQLTEKQIDIEDKLQDINEKERNFDRSVLESSKDLDVKYAELQSKIDKDIRQVTEKEKDLELLSKELKRKEEKLLQRESDIDEVEKLLQLKIEQVNLEEASLMKLDQEIKDWEKMHWKFQRNTIPPSAIPETISEDLKAKYPGLENIRK